MIDLMYQRVQLTKKITIGNPKTLDLHSLLNQHQTRDLRIIHDQVRNQQQGQLINQVLSLIQDLVHVRIRTHVQVQDQVIQNHVKIPIQDQETMEDQQNLPLQLVREIMDRIIQNHDKPDLQAPNLQDRHQRDLQAIHLEDHQQDLQDRLQEVLQVDLRGRLPKVLTLPKEVVDLLEAEVVDNKTPSVLNTT